MKLQIRVVSCHCKVSSAFRVNVAFIAPKVILSKGSLLDLQCHLQDRWNNGDCASSNVAAGEFRCVTCFKFTVYTQ